MKLNTPSVAFSISILANANAKTKFRSQRIVNGIEVAPNTYPWFTAPFFGCGSSLVHKDILISAAHCLPGISCNEVVTNFTNSPWNNNPTGGEIYNEIEEYIHHKNFNNDLANDIMVIKLKTPVTDDIVPIAYNTNANIPASGDTVRAIGIGADSSGGELTPTLEYVDLKSVDSVTCSAEWSDFDSIYGDNSIGFGKMCAKELNVDTCQGDSGGPLFVDGFNPTLIGITSYGIGCADSISPSPVYARISDYKDFIRSAICCMSSDPPDDCALDTDCPSDGIREICPVDSCILPDDEEGETPTQGPLNCNLDEDEMYFLLTTDEYGSETSVTLTNDCEGMVLYSEDDYCSSSTYQTQACVPKVSLGSTYTFVINDTYGDGICCAEGDGSYSISIGDKEHTGGSFTYSATYTFGTACSSPIQSPSDEDDDDFPSLAPTNDDFSDSSEDNDSSSSSTSSSSSEEEDSSLSSSSSSSLSSSSSSSSSEEEAETKGAEVYTSFCFSSHTTAKVKGKGDLQMDMIEVGDEVITRSGSYKKVFAIDHQHETKLTEFVQVYCEGKGKPLELTANHMIFKTGEINPVPAGTLKVGDRVETYDGDYPVIDILTIVRKGLFSPLTTDGTIVASGIVASTYSSLAVDTKWIEVYDVKLMSFQNFFASLIQPYKLVCTTLSMKLCKTDKEKLMISDLAFKIFDMLHSIGFNHAFIPFTAVIAMLMNIVSFAFVPVTVVWVTVTNNKFVSK